MTFNFFYFAAPLTWVAERTVMQGLALCLTDPLRLMLIKSFKIILFKRRFSIAKSFGKSGQTRKKHMVVGTFPM